MMLGFREINHLSQSPSQNHIGGKKMKRGRKREYYVGYKLGRYEIIEQLRRSGNSRKFLLRCENCGNEEMKWSSDLSTGNYGMCDCNLGELRKNVVRV